MRRRRFAIWFVASSFLFAPLAAPQTPPPQPDLATADWLVTQSVVLNAGSIVMNPSELLESVLAC
jgi:hypothetical protein